MKCKHVQSKLLDYSENLLDDKTRFRIEEHLQKCSTCARELQEITKTITTLQSIPFPEPSEAFWTDFTSGVMRKINMMKAPSKLDRFFYFPRFRMAVVCLVVLVILGGLYMYFQPAIQQILHPVEMTAKGSEQDSTSPGVPDPENSFETALHRIASENLTQDILEQDLALFNGITNATFDIDYSDEMVYSLLNSLTEEEKETLLSELYKMRNTSQ